MANAIRPSGSELDSIDGLLLNDSTEIKGTVRFSAGNGKTSNVPYSIRVSGTDVLESYVEAGAYDKAVDLVSRSVDKSRQEWNDHKPSGMGAMGDAYGQMGVNGRYLNAVVEGAEALLKIGQKTRNEQFGTEAVAMLTKYLKDEVGPTSSNQGVAEQAHKKLMPLDPDNRGLGMFVVNAYIADRNYEAVRDMVKGTPLAGYGARKVREAMNKAA